MSRLKELVSSPDCRAARAFELAIQTVIVMSLLAFSLETLPDLPDWGREILSWVEVATVLIFTAEYLLRLLAAEKKSTFVFSFFGIIDLVAILPFYLTLVGGLFPGADLRSIRIIRLLRIFRVLKLARYSKAINRFHRAFLASKEEIVLYLAVTLILLYFAAAGIYFFEHDAQPDQFKSIFHSLWWAITTLTTVGYGDAYPVTAGGRLFTFFILMLGLGVVSVPAGLVATALEQARGEELADRDKRQEPKNGSQDAE
jgi:voltage-gated potassium channel